jgi:hypothetical protein
LGPPLRQGGRAQQAAGVAAAAAAHQAARVSQQAPKSVDADGALAGVLVLQRYRSRGGSTCVCVQVLQQGGGGLDGREGPGGGGAQPARCIRVLVVRTGSQHAGHAQLWPAASASQRHLPHSTAQHSTAQRSTPLVTQKQVAGSPCGTAGRILPASQAARRPRPPPPPPPPRAAAAAARRAAAAAAPRPRQAPRRRGCCVAGGPRSGRGAPAAAARSARWGFPPCLPRRVLWARSAASGAAGGGRCCRRGHRRCPAGAGATAARRRAPQPLPAPLGR